MVDPILADPAFLACLHTAAANQELVVEFDRLNGSNLSRKGSVLDLLIDDSTGRTDAGVQEFVEFVKTCIYERLPPDVLESLREP